MNFIFIFILSSDINLLRKKSVKQKIKKQWPKLDCKGLFTQNAIFLKILASIDKIVQGGHGLWKTGKTGKMVKRNSLQGKIREFRKRAENQGKIREFIFLKMFSYASK